MSERVQEPLKTQHVFEINPGGIIDPFERKAVLAMQATGLFVAGDDAFEETNETLIKTSEAVGKPATMTYEDIVFRNNFPGGIEAQLFSGVRVISADSVTAEAEARFYQTHRRIEDQLYRTIGELMFLDKHPSLFGLGALRRQPFSGPHCPDETSPGKTLEGALSGIRTFHEQDPEAFSAFRPYFTGLNGYPGASGLYSESIPIIDLLVDGGKNIGEEERETMQENITQCLYPDHNGGSVLLRTLLLFDAGFSPLTLPEYLRQDLRRQLNQFRGRHMHVVRKFVPDAMDGTAAGSGGVSNVSKYLTSKVVARSGGESDD
jgi:hypothetical protein